MDAELELLIEVLARAEHERWSHWQRFVHGQCATAPGGGLLIPAELVARWNRQIGTPFDQLSEEEKESDREQVRAYLPVVNAFIDKAIKEGRASRGGRRR
jgi:hypothetical protein